MLVPQIEAHAEDPPFAPGLAGSGALQGNRRPLKELTGIHVGFWQEGIARAATEEEEVSHLRLRAAWQRSGATV